MSLYSLPRPSGFRLDPTRNLYLDSRSGSLITAGKYQMPLPTTDAELVAQGWPSILGAVDGDLWLCDEGAGNLVGEINGYQLAPQNAPLQDRSFNGLPYAGSLWAKKAVECVSNSTQRFDAANGAVLDIAGQDFTLSFLIRPRDRTSPDEGYLCNKRAAGNGFSVRCYSGTNRLLLSSVADGVRLYNFASVQDGATHLLTISVARAGNVSFYIDGTATAATACLSPASITNGELFRFANLDAGAYCFDGQVSWFYVNIGVAASRVGHDALWAALSSNNLGTANTYTRANPLTTRISNVMGYVATAGANQFMPGYNANASAGDNPLELGVVCEDGASFLGLGSYNMPAYVGTNAVVTATDGPSGMRDACRVADTDGVNAGYATSGAAVLAGATNVPFIYSAYVKSGGVGTNAVYQSYYTGDGGGPELFTNWTIAGAVSAVWRPFIGLTHTPVGAAHTAVVTRLIPTDNVGASLGTVDFAEVWGRQNAIGDRMTWRRVAAGAAATTGTPSLAYDNTGNALYSPAQGRLDVRVSDFAKQAERVIANYATEAGPYNCCTDPTNVWVSNLTTGSLTKRRLSDGGLVGHYALGVTPGHICYDSVNNYIWVCDRNARTVLAVNAATGGVVATYNAGPGGSQSRGICWDGTYVWVSNFLANTISKVRCSDGTLIGSYATAVGPYFSCYANGSVWVSCYTANFIRKLTAATGAFVADYAINRPTQPAYDGTNIWIPSETGNNVRKLTEATGAFVADYATGTSPSGCVYDGTNVWVGNTADQTVVKLLAATGALVQRYAGFGANPFGMAWDGINLWVSIDGGNVLTRVGAPQVFLALGADGGQGALWLDYAGGKTYAPLQGTTPQLRLRLWDDVAVLVGTATCGAVTTAEHIYVVEWDAALGKASVMEGATVLGSFAVVWVPEPNAITPIYVGCDSAGANAARCHVTLLEGFDF